MSKKDTLKLAPLLPDKYGPNSVARKIITEVPLATSNDTVGSTIKRINRNIKRFKAIDYIYIINEKANLLGIISYKELLEHNKDIKLGDIMHTKLVSASPAADQEKVADLAVRHKIKAIPIIENKRLIGVMSIEQILLTLNRALREDILHMAGIHKAHLNYENTLDVPLPLAILHRIPYLLIGLLGIIIAAFYVSFFEATLQKHLILAFFIPAIVYLSDALGTQLQTLLIRDLVILGNELDIKRYIFRQVVIGMLIALLISGIIFLTIDFIWAQPFMAFVISLATFVSVVITSFIQLKITLLINRYKLDPALGSGPIATVISDILSIIIYFAIAVLFLGAL